MAATTATTTLVRKLERRDRLSEEEICVLEDAVERVREVAADDDMVREGDRPDHSTLLLDGFAARYNVLANGNRQITALHVSGEFVDLHGFLLRPMDHTICALTPCRIAVVPHEKLRAITNDHPRLTRLLWLSTLIDGAIHRAWLVSAGRRSALGRLAHLLCELYCRLEPVGLVQGRSFELPLTQQELGDILGLSTVHVNRIVQELRREGLIVWQGSTLQIKDWPRLSDTAEFDPTYLNLHMEPR